MTKSHKIIIIAAAASAITTCLVICFYLFRLHQIAKTTTNNLTSNSNNMNLPRGYRNNNPLNIRKSNERWIGKISNGTDTAFEQFENMGYGYRAALKLIINYIKKGYNSIETIISRWAPANENNTQGYISNVSKFTKIDKKTIISPSDEKSLKAIVRAMSYVENGKYYDNIDKDIDAGWQMI